MQLNLHQIPDFIFSSALFINALLFIPQLLKIIKEKTAQDVSLLTFVGFWLIQLAIVWHGFLHQDFLLFWGYLFSMLTCGAVIGLILIYRQKAPALPLPEQLELLDNVLALMPGHIFWLDQAGRYLGCNNQQAQSAGLHSRKDIIGKRNADLPWNFNAGQLPESLDDLNQEVIRTRQERIIEEPAVLQDGTEATFLSHKVPLYNHRGRVIGMAGISIDITERKQAEVALQKAKQAAENAQRTQQAFLENISHDLRTPFCGLLTIAQLLEKKEADEEKRTSLHCIADSAQVLLAHLNDIIDYMSAASSPPLLDKPFLLSELIQDIYAMMAPAAQAKQLILTCQGDWDLPKMVRGDRLRTQRILLHLIANAIKFTAKGYVDLRVKVFANKQKRWLILFIISDTGIGIPEDKRDIIFEPFNRLTPAHQGVYAGKGLGLSVVKQFLDELGGEALVEGKPGKGTTFELLIPFKKLLQTQEDTENLG